ncbi:MAG: NADH-quinone oxidoreductase subunit NuoK [Cyanobacteria bacterium NC_groundwater_1444_Ag_S-0.65um_54_12]|nr:NADH-quinone oxidoreductase subunit NuoK [Cyanobacteria bacterium NC_groundwater_1444_Ag_S-0.65um_54_12]
MSWLSIPHLAAPFGLSHYLILAGALFCLGLYGVLTLRHAVRVLMCLELMLNAVNIVLVAFNNYLPAVTPLRGQIFSLFVIAVAAAETSVALAIFLLMYRHYQSVDIEKVDTLKW